MWLGCGGVRKGWNGTAPDGIILAFLQTQYDALKKQMEVMEVEVMEARLVRAAEINGEVDDDDAGGSEAGAAQQWPDWQALMPTPVTTPLVRACLLCRALL